MLRVDGPGPTDFKCLRQVPADSEQMMWTSKVQAMYTRIFGVQQLVTAERKRRSRGIFVDARVGRVLQGSGAPTRTRERDELLDRLAKKPNTDPARRSVFGPPPAASAKKALEAFENQLLDAARQDVRAAAACRSAARPQDASEIHMPRARTSGEALALTTRSRGKASSCVC